MATHSITIDHTLEFVRKLQAITNLDAHDRAWLHWKTREAVHDVERLLEVHITF